MFGDSDLLQRDVLVLRATAPPDEELSVLDETGREIGRFVEEQVDAQDGWLVLYDREKTRVLAVEKGTYDSDGDRTNPLAVVNDLRGRPVNCKHSRGWIRDASGQRMCGLKGGLKGRGRSRVHGFWIENATKTEVCTIVFGQPPDGDYRPGVTFLFTITSAITRELRLAALGWGIVLIEGFSRKSPWMLKTSAKMGVPWPGSAKRASAAPAPITGR